MTHAEVVEQVRERLARDGAPLSPAHVGRRALRDEGRPVGDATVLAVLDVLRRDVLGAGPLEPLLRARRGDRRAGQRPGAGLRRPRRRARADRGPVPRRRRRTPARAAAGRRRRATARRRHAVRRPAAARRHPVPRGARAAGPARHAALAPGPAPAGLHPRRAGRRRHGLRGGGRPAPPDRRAAGSRSWSAAAPGSGKTTLLTALLSLVDPTHRLVLVEDASELRPDHPHVVGARGPAGERRGRGRGARCRCWSGRRCGCAPTGWSSARSAAPRSPTCSPR